MARAERRELKHRMSILLAHLLKWKFQPDHPGKSWSATIRLQRGEIHDALYDMPSLRHCFEDERWHAAVWRNAVYLAAADMSLDFASEWIWSLDQVLNENFWPD